MRQTIANLSGGGAGALGFGLACVDHLHHKKGIKFNTYYGVSAGTLAALLLASHAEPKGAIKSALSITDFYDPHSLRTWVRSFLPWRPKLKSIAEYGPMEKKLKKILKGKKIHTRLVIQLANLYNKKQPEFFVFERGMDASAAIPYVRTAMSIPGMMDAWETDGMLLCDAGAIISSVADRHIPKSSTVYTIDIHSSIDMTPETFKEAGIADMISQTTTGGTHQMYLRDKEQLKKDYPDSHLVFVEAEKDLEVFKMNPTTVRESMDHGYEIMRRDFS